MDAVHLATLVVGGEPREADDLVLPCLECLGTLL